MTLSLQVVSLPLAKRLRELGVKQDSYFWWELEHTLERTALNYFPAKIVPRSYYEGTSPKSGFVAAFTAAELGELLPRLIYDPETKRPQWLGMTNGQPTMEVWYVHYEPMNERTEKYCTEGDTEADARAKMLVYLIENKLMV